MKQHDFQLVTNISKQSNFELIHNIYSWQRINIQILKNVKHPSQA